MAAKNERVAIVTGATSGIGEAITRKFITSGIGVIGNGRNAAKLDALRSELGEAFYGVAGDATDPETPDKLFTSAEDHFGRTADIVIANAGRGLGGSVTNADLSQFEELLKINVTSTAALLQKTVQKTKEAQQCTYPENVVDIIIIGSVAGRNISPFSTVYGASKAAVHALAEGLRREVGPNGIRVSLVEPGAALTGFQAGAGYSEELVQSLEDDFGPLLTGEDIADSVHFIVTQPPHVHISDIVVRPTRQAYP